eukprot:CAMPEP_0206010624 /NCGR_PEP_ID=MMETSP1464-20131121/11965_1 /ASSEMBLY_ACC=CAM_ASM_001124 /TAXON_ID=119497 /ORGANISM="Exanthemachrysis gayraliae, Strain RCC1523" /LENGTH=111 /DNA_ID=CAMNT_0053384251 /DNA_START=215 /DNA_END=550 /DNA_ORIENTATION=+
MSSRVIWSQEIRGCGSPGCGLPGERLQLALELPERGHLPQKHCALCCHKRTARAASAGSRSRLRCQQPSPAAGPMATCPENTLGGKWQMTAWLEERIAQALRAQEAHRAPR